MISSNPVILWILRNICLHCRSLIVLNCLVIVGSISYLATGSWSCSEVNLSIFDLFRMNRSSHIQILLLFDSVRGWRDIVINSFSMDDSLVGSLNSHCFRGWWIVSKSHFLLEINLGLLIRLLSIL